MSKMSKPSKLLNILKSVKPTKMWIDGKCYDIDNPINKTNEGISDLNECKYFEVKTVNDELYSTSFRLPALYYANLHRYPNFVLNDLENHTGTQIIVPKYGDEGSILVTGKNIDNVADARLKLHSIFSLIRNRNVAAQFISIPVLAHEVKSNFQTFKTRVLNDDGTEDLHESVFQKPEKLHLTVSVFALFDHTEISEAIKSLDEFKANFMDPFVLKTGPLKINVSGLDCMNDDHSKVNVLFANAKFVNESEEHSLQKVVNSISNHFYEKGLLIQYRENVKLHVTLMNTKYRKVEGRKRRWRDKKQTFDARAILEKYKDFEFGESNFDSIHLSLIASNGVDGFYKPLSIITF